MFTIYLTLQYCVLKRECLQSKLFRRQPLAFRLLGPRHHNLSATLAAGTCAYNLCTSHSKTHNQWSIPRDSNSQQPRCKRGTLTIASGIESMTRVLCIRIGGYKDHFCCLCHRVVGDDVVETSLPRYQHGVIAVIRIAFKIAKIQVARPLCSLLYH